MEAGHVQGAGMVPRPCVGARPDRARNRVAHCVAASGSGARRMYKPATTFSSSSIRHRDNPAGRDGVIFRQSLRVAGASYTHIGVTGIGVPHTGGIIGRVKAAFLCPMVRFMAGRGRGEQSPPMLVSVRQPEPDRHPIGVGRRDTTRLRATIMTTSHQGDPRPQSLSRSAIEKRVKRYLARSGFSLVKSRIGTAGSMTYSAATPSSTIRTSSLQSMLTSWPRPVSTGS